MRKYFISILAILFFMSFYDGSQAFAWRLFNRHLATSYAQPPNQVNSNTQQVKDPQILLREDFNSGKMSSGLLLQNWTINPNAFQIVRDNDPKHGLVAKIIFNKLDVASSSRSRVEILNTGHFQQGHRYIIHWEVKLAPDYQYDFKQSEIIGQIHQASNDGSPPFSILLQGNDLIASIKTDKDSPAQDIFIGDAYPGYWEKWTLDWVPSPTATGYYRLYRGNKLVINFRGKSSYDEPDAGYFKLGIYKWNWHTTQPSDVTTRTLYLDNIFIQEMPK